MAAKPRMSREYAARLIWSILTFDAPAEGFTLDEICGRTNLTKAQARPALALLRDSLHELGTPLNVSGSHPYRYSIPKPSADAESKHYELRRTAILCDTGLRRVQIHAAASREHHPHEREGFDRFLNAVNRARKAIAPFTEGDAA